MARDFLEKTVTALEANRDCELAHTSLLILAENGCELSNHVWLDTAAFAEGIPELIKVPHIRRALMTVSFNSY